MIPFSLIDSINYTDKNWYFIEWGAFNIRNKTATISEVASDKSYTLMDADGNNALNIICYWFLEWCRIVFCSSWDLLFNYSAFKTFFQSRFILFSFAAL